MVRIFPRPRVVSSVVKCTMLAPMLLTPVSWLRFGKPPPPPPPPPSFTPSILVAGGALLLCAAVLLLRLTASSRSSSTDAAPKHRGVALASFSVFLAVSASAIQFPFMQTRRDALGCDAMCQGGQTSLRSGLGLLGAAIIGRSSDQFGRIPMLWLGTLASLAGLAINGFNAHLRPLCSPSTDSTEYDYP